MAKNKKSKLKVKKSFYRLWWFWLIVGVIFAGSWCLLFIKDLNIRSSIIGILGVWGSTIATIFIGIIATKQSEQYTFSSKKQQLLNDLNENNNAIQNAINGITTADKYNLLVDSFKAARMEQSLKRSTEKFAITIKIDALINKLFQTKQILQTCKYSLKTTIELNNEIINLANFVINNFQVKDLEKETDEDTVYTQAYENLNFVSEWNDKADKLNYSLKSDYQKLFLRLLNAENLAELDTIQSDINNIQQQLVDYYK